MKIRRSSTLKLYSFPVLSGFILAIFLLTFSVNVHADSSYFPMGQNDNNLIPDDIIDYIDSNYHTDDNYYVCNLYSVSSSSIKVRLFLFSKESTGTVCGELNSNGHQFSWYTVGNLSSPVNVSGSSYQGLSYSLSSGNITSSSPNGSFWTISSNLESSLYSTDTSFISNFDIYTNNTENASLVLKYSDDPNYDVVLTGHAVPYDPLEIPTFGLGIVGPNSVPLDYVPTGYVHAAYTPPSFDSNSPVESLYDITSYNFSYLKDYLTGSINNLANNISGLGNNISSNIQYYGGLIINALNNSIKTFYLNMLGLIQPITVVFSSLLLMGTVPGSDTFSFSQLTNVLLVPDTTNVVELFLQHDDFHLITIGQNLVTMSLTIYNSIVGLTPSGVIHVPSCYYHGQQIGNFDIDFSWFNQYKAYSDILISGFLIFGYFYWLYVTFASHIKGVFMPDVTPEDDSYSRHHIGF